MGSWIAFALMSLAFLPVIVLALYLNRRDPRRLQGDCSDPAHNDDPRFGGMNKQGLGWGTRDNNRGGL